MPDATPAIVSAPSELAPARRRTLLAACGAHAVNDGLTDLIYVLLPIFFVMAFLGFPLPVAPPPATKPAVEHATVIKKKKRLGLVMPEERASKKT